VSARRPLGALEIVVADTGFGIAREDLGKLFTPLAQRLAELHSSTNEVESEPDKGSTFTLHLSAEEH